MATGWRRQSPSSSVARRVAVTGANGQLGREVVRAFRDAGDEVSALARPAFDVLRADDLSQLTDWRPQIVVNCAAWTDVDGCARDPDRAMKINGEAAGAVAQAAARAKAMVIQISTNEVFDGTAMVPYDEDASPNPINPYGASKLLGEQLVASAAPRHLVVRTAWLFGASGSSFVTRITAAAQRAEADGSPLRVVDDEWGNPTPAAGLADALVAVSHRSDVSGRLHIAGTPPVSRYGWACMILQDLEVEIQPIGSAEFIRPSRPPLRAVLETARSRHLGLAPLRWQAVAQPTQ
jgi:dTDP-4-dehydrorhamnose reductase